MSTSTESTTFKPELMNEMALEAAQRISDLAVISPVVEAASFCHGSNTVHLKDETKQPVRSFKNRGSGNAVSYYQENGAEHFVAASAGNHARGVALAADYFDVDATIVVPECTAQVNKASIAKFGGKLIVHGATFDESLKFSLDMAEDTNAQHVHPYADELVIAGQATIGLELLEQTPDMTHLVLPVGGGGLLAGVATVVKHKLPDVKVVSAQVRGCDSFSKSMAAGSPQELESVDTRFGGVAVRKTNSLNFEIGAKVVDQVVVVETDEVYKAVYDHKEAMGVLLEPAGAVGLAVSRKLAQSKAMADANIVTVASGANPTPIVSSYISAKARRFGWGSTD